MNLKNILKFNKSRLGFSAVLLTVFLTAIGVWAQTFQKDDPIFLFAPGEDVRLTQPNFLVSDKGPVISAIAVAGDFPEYEVTWETDSPSTSVLEYETKTNYLLTGEYSKYLESDDLVTNHSLFLSSLAPGESYYFVVRSTGEFDLESVSSQQTLTTPGSPAPTITSVTTLASAGGQVSIRGTGFKDTGNMVHIVSSGGVETTVPGTFLSDTLIRFWPPEGVTLDSSYKIFVETGGATTNSYQYGVGPIVPQPPAGGGGLGLHTIGTGGGSGGTTGGAGAGASVGGEEKGLVPCGKDLDKNGVVSGAAEECTAKDIVPLAKNIMDLILMMMSVISSLLFAYCGFIYMKAGGDSGATDRAKSIIKKVIIGYVMVLGAWAFVTALEKAFYSNDPNAKPKSYLTS